MGTNFLELATAVKYLGAKWLLEKKLILRPGWLRNFVLVLLITPPPLSGQALLQDKESPTSAVVKLKPEKIQA